jgi:transposase-like protein
MTDNPIWLTRAQIIQDLATTNLTYEEIAVKHGVSFGMVRNANRGIGAWCREFDVSYPIRRTWKENQTLAVSLSKEGMTDEAIAKKLGLEEVAILNMRIRHFKTQK